MPYEMKPDTFLFEWRAENIDSRYPAIQAKIKVGNEQHDFAAWIRKGKYGIQMSGQTPGLTEFLRAVLGSPIKKQQPITQQQQTSPKPANPPKPEERQSLIR